MAITVTPLLTTISNCDATTGWTAATVNTDIYKEGTGSLSASVSNTTSTTYYYTLAAPTDFTGYHLYQWLCATSRVDTKANGGLRMYMYCSNTAYRTWYVGGNDNYAGGWQCFVVDPNNTSDVGLSSGTFDITQVTRVGVQFKTIQSIKAGLLNVFWDIVRYGSGLRITSADTDTITLQNIYDTNDTSTNAYGIVSKNNDIFFVQGELIFGSTTAGQHISFSDSDQVLVFLNRPVASTLYKIKVEGNSTGTINFQLGSSSGSGSSTLGYDGVLVKSAISTLTYSLDFADANIDNLKLYGSTFAGAGNVNIGSTSQALGGSGTTVHMVDSTFSSPTRVVRNVSSSATKLYLRNKITFATDSAASLDLYDVADTSSSEWNVLGSTTSGFGPGFITTSTGTQTINLTGFDFNSMDKPYITIAAESETWNSINPLWTIGTGQTELDFLGTSQGEVNERYSIAVTVQQASGTKIQDSRVKIVEENPTPAIANQVNSDSNGLASTSVLTKKFTASSPTADLTVVTHSSFALKVYKYGRTPFVGALTVTSAVTSGVTLLTDSFQVEATEATAVSDGTQKVILVESASLTQSHSIIKFTGGTGTLTVGSTVDGVSSGASGTVEEIIEGNSVAGTVILKTRNSTAFSGTESLNENAGAGDWTATLTSGSEQRFYWLIQAGTISSVKRTFQQLYDHFQAKLAEATLDTADGWDDVVLEGRAEYANPIQGVSVGTTNTFETIRNAALTHGWVVSGLNSMTGIVGYTDNSGTLWAPATTVTLEINGVKTGVEPTYYVRVRIEAAAGGSLPVGTEIMNTQATTSYGGSGYYKATTSYSYTADQPVTVRARYKGYLPYEASATIGSGGLTVTAIWLPDPNYDE